MRSRHTLRILLALGLLCAAGCRPSTPSLPPGTPTKATADFTAEMRQTLAPMLTPVVSAPGQTGWGENGSGAQAWLSDQDREKCLAYLREAKAKHELTADGQAALQAVKSDLSTLAIEARDQGRWRLTAAAIEGYEILAPKDAKFQELKQRAENHVNRPEVIIKGFFEDMERKVVYALLEITLHPSNEVKQISVRKGDEFHDLRFVDIVGDLRGIKLEYLKIPGEVYAIMRPQ